MALVNRLRCKLNLDLHPVQLRLVVPVVEKIGEVRDEPLRIMTLALNVPFQLNFQLRLFKEIEKKKKN